MDKIYGTSPNIQSIPIREKVSEVSTNPFNTSSSGGLTATSSNSQGNTLGLMGNHQNEEHGSRLYTYI